MPLFTPDLANPHSRGWGGDTHSSWRNSRGWLAVGIILLGGLYDPKASALLGLTHYGWLWLLLWLAVAVRILGVMDKIGVKNRCIPYAARLYTRSKLLNTKNAFFAAQNRSGKMAPKVANNTTDACPVISVSAAGKS